MNQEGGPWVGREVAVLYGGDSEERQISLKTGRAMGEALESLGYQVRWVDATTEGLRQLAAEPPEVALLALHGGRGEDGSVQGLLECLGVPYTGSGVYTCAVTMDKAAAKALWSHEGLPTPPWRLWSRELVREVLARPELPVHAPCVVKPALSGSSVGVTLVREQAELRAALEGALGCLGPVLVEDLIEGRELTVAVMDGQVMGVIEIVPQREFYDFEAKYNSQTGTAYRLPAPLTPEEHKRLVRLVERAHEVVGGRGVNRIDVMMDEQGGFWLLECNVMPGMTETSLVPKAAQAAGIGFARFVEMMLNGARLDADGRR